MENASRSSGFSTLRYFRETRDVCARGSVDNNAINAKGQRSGRKTEREEFARGMPFLYALMKEPVPY